MAMNYKNNSKYKRYWLQLLIAMLLLLLPGYQILNKMIVQDLSNIEELTKQELKLLSHLSKQLLQGGDYDEVAPLFNRWSKNYSNTHHIILSSMNGYIIAETKKNIPVRHKHVESIKITYGYRGEAQLVLTNNIDGLYQQFYEIIFYGVLVWLLLGMIGAYIIYNLIRHKVENKRLEELGQRLVQTNDKLEKEQSLLKYLMDSIPDLIFFKDQESHYLGCNKAFEKYSGRTEKEHIGKTDFDFFDKETAIFFRSNDKLMMDSGNTRRNEEWVTYPDGNKVLLDTLKTPYYDQNGQTLGIIGISRDITDIKKYQEQLEAMAFLDPLTNLPNRRNLMEKIQSAMAQADRKSNLLAICTIDLDGFKEVNDNYGHKIGDEVLIEFSHRIKKTIRSVDTASRWGGDEFTILYTDIVDIHECINCVERLLDMASIPINVNNNIFNLSASIGLTIYPNDKSDPDTLLRHADQAMYDAKLAGKNRYKFFDHEQNKLLHDYHDKQNQIEQAIKSDEMVLYFQPQIHLKQGSPYGVEALIRWQHPRDGILPPIKFLPFIEGHQVSVQLDWWVIEHALLQLETWMKNNIYIHMSINVSSITFQQADFVQKLKSSFDDFIHVTPEMISLELLETTALDNLEQVSLKMKECQEIGVQFSLDDFGTGYSSLTYLSKLPVNVLKIDQSFVRRMIVDKGNESIVEGIIQLASVFDRFVVAEGVEEIEHGNRLLSLGCHFVQGYAIAKPLPADELVKWLSYYKAPDEWLNHKQGDKVQPSSIDNKVISFSKSKKYQHS